MKQTLLERFASKILITDNCWEWIGTKGHHGYGVIKVCGKMLRAHRLSYEIHIGFIPVGLVLDHLCRNTSCVNPWHLEPVADKENIFRGNGVPAKNARKIYCESGHALVGDNLSLYEKRRICKTCKKRNSTRLRRRMGARERVAGFCRIGHALTSDNIYKTKYGVCCKTCHLKRSAERYSHNKAFPYHKQLLENI